MSILEVCTLYTVRKYMYTIQINLIWVLVVEDSKNNNNILVNV